MKKSIILFILVFFVSCNKENILPSVDVYGHAGTTLHRDRAVFPANSYKSIQYALDALGADGVEVDLQLTKDSIFVLYHDQFLDNSSDFSGCIGEYNFKDIKDLKLDNTKYSIARLSDILEFTQSRNAKVYLDAKVYSYCSGQTVSISAFQFALNNCLSNVSQAYLGQIYLGMTNQEFLNQVNFNQKCFEYSNINSFYADTAKYNLESVILNASKITSQDANKLTELGLYWGVFGIKDKWSINKAVALKPKFVISDNIAYTNKVTE